ncbi:MAG TPA: OmpA family protein [Flavipsychrobacter sp.]|nr:OmpA family protein [Flavipsychrobacter sp.]
MKSLLDSRVNKLYFSSNGWVTMGGFDIYSADGGPSRYANVMNLGYPINTSADELYFIKDPVGKPDGYLVSNRVGSIALKNPTCCDDIWRIQYEPRLLVAGRVIDCETKQPVEDVVVKMVDETGDLKTFNSTDGTFGFNMSRSHTYVITADKQGFSSTRATVNTSDVKRSDPDDTASVTICLSSISNAFRVSNVYYDYDKATLRPESVASLDSLVNFMRDNASLSVEIYSFADAKGTDQYNKNLSERRAQSVKDYLVNNGIEDARMIVKGYGEKMPAAPNTTTTGSDNPVGRQLNRRTEFRIVTDVPTRRIIFNSAKPGSMDEQEKNLIQDENGNADGELDSESDAGNPGSRVNQQ